MQMQRWLTHHSHMIDTKAKVILERGVVVKDGETETSWFRRRRMDARIVRPHGRQQMRKVAFTVSRTCNIIFESGVQSSALGILSSCFWFQLFFPDFLWSISPDTNLPQMVPSDSVKTFHRWMGNHPRTNGIVESSGRKIFMRYPAGVTVWFVW